MSGLGLEGGAGEVESVSIAERLKLTDNIHVMDVPGGGYILLCGIYGEIEGHDKLPAGMKSTSYEKLLPVIAQAENCGDVKGVLTLINTVGGDVESGLAISEMLSSLSKPVVNIVLGGGHSIGVPLAVSGNVSFIVPTATMIVHPIRTNTAVLGVKQNFEYIEKMQERIIQFTVDHSSIGRKELEKLMFNTTELTKDVGSVLIVKFHRILYKHRSREVGHELITGNFDGNNTGSYRISSSQQFGTSGYFQEYFWSGDRYGYII